MKTYKVKATGTKKMKRAPKFLEISTSLKASSTEEAITLVQGMFIKKFKSEPDCIEVERIKGG